MSSSQDEWPPRPAFFGFGFVGGLIVSMALAFAVLIAVIDDQFVPWPRTPQIAPASAEHGAELATELGCVACHSVDGSVLLGPSWAGVHLSERSFADGTTAIADDSYLQRSITAPDELVVAGFPAGVMPQDYETRLTGTEINSLVAYIASLNEV